jgi:hypothetical protein
MIGPNLRRALHHALDLVLDAVNEDARGEAPKKRRRAVADDVHEMPANAAPELVAKVAKAWERAGYRKAG